MRRRALLAVARKDISAISSNLQVLLPMLILPPSVIGNGNCGAICNMVTTASCAADCVRQPSRDSAQ